MPVRAGAAEIKIAHRQRALAETIIKIGQFQFLLLQRHGRQLKMAAIDLALERFQWHQLAGLLQVARGCGDLIQELLIINDEARSLGRKGLCLSQAQAGNCGFDYESTETICLSNAHYRFNYVMRSPNSSANCWLSHSRRLDLRGAD